MNELITNALKHGFPNGRSGNIHVRLASLDRRTTLAVQDDGTGFPAGLDFRQSRSLGLQLVCTLTNQLGGTIALNRDTGTEFVITFPDSELD